jgi:hypothetical protein
VWWLAVAHLHLPITVAACVIIILYLFWFKAIPDFWRMITKKED